MAEMMKKMPQDILTMGNIDPVGVLSHMSPDEVKTETLKLLEACSKYQNFLISSGCDIPPATPWENVDAFFNAVKEFYDGRK
jgi:uroporphyrinogen decarboxylase